VNAEAWPLFTRFPRLATLPHLDLRMGATPVQWLPEISPRLWIKRDDLSALPVGGNKVRGLEFLLGAVGRNDVVTTIGAQASTHALVTAIHARGRAKETRVGTWPQEINPVAAEVAARLPLEARVSPRLHALVALAWVRWRRLCGDIVIPPGGTSPLGVLGHVNAGLELSCQIAAGEIPEPESVVVPLGTGGTAVGLSIGLGIAGRSTQVIGVRVVPRIVARRGHLRSLSRRTVALIERLAGERLREPIKEVQIDHSAHGGAYARPLPRAAEGKNLLMQRDIHLDDTYSAKAFTAAIERARSGNTLFWLTFDSRWIRN
jgi:D-cysteine desulfhydrase